MKLSKGCPCGTEYTPQCNWLWCERCEAEALANYVDVIFANGEARLLAFEVGLDRLKLWGRYWKMVSRPDEAVKWREWV